MAEGGRNGMTIPVAITGETQAQQHLRGKLGGLPFYFSVMSYNAPMVVVIGVVPIMVARGTGVGTPMSFVMAGIVLACFAVGFTMMSRMLPRPGGFYSMITAGLGRSIGLGSGLLALLGYFCAYAGTFAFGGLAMDSLVHTTLNGPQLPWYGWGSVFWVACAILGYVRVEVSANVLTAILFLGLVTIAAYDVLVLVKGGAGHAGISLGPVRPTHWFDGSFSMGILLALGMYGGFEVAVLFREELDNPDRTIPRVTYGVIILAMATYAP
jgi:amino acid transporter